MHGKLDEVKLQRGEPATSFFARMAAHYQLMSARELAGDFDLDFDRLSGGHAEELSKLATLTGCDLGELILCTPSSAQKGTLRIGTELIATKFSRRRHLSVCLECWAEDIQAAPGEMPEAAVYVRLPWLFWPVQTCAKHSRPLLIVKTAPNNGHLYDTALMATDVVTKLSDLMASQTERNASEFEMYVSARLEGRAFQGGMLDALGLSEVFSICAHIGRAVNLVSDRLDGLSEANLHRAYAEGFRTLSGGRATLSHALMALLEHKSDKLPPLVGPQNLIGKAHAILTADSIGKRRYEPVYHDVANAIYDVMPWGPGDPGLFGVPITHRRFYCVSEAAATFGLASPTVVKYVEATGIARIFVSNCGRRRFLIDAEAAHRTFDTSGYVRVENLSRWGITEVQGRSLMASGHLRTILPRELVGDGQIPPIKVKDVNDLMDRFLKRAEPLDRIPEGCSNMRFVARAIRGRLTEVHELILDGKVWTGRLRSESLPYASIVVNPSEVRAALGGTETLNSAEMSIASGLPKCVLAAMCTSGKITFISERNLTTGKLRRSFSHETLTWAREELISLTRLARRLCRQPKTLGPALSAMGIQPYCAVQLGNRTHTVYQVRHVSHLLP